MPYTVPWSFSLALWRGPAFLLLLLQVATALLDPSSPNPTTRQTTLLIASNPSWAAQAPSEALINPSSHPINGSRLVPGQPTPPPDPSIHFARAFSLDLHDPRSMCSSSIRHLDPSRLVRVPIADGTSSCGLCYNITNARDDFWQVYALSIGLSPSSHLEASDGLLRELFASPSAAGSIVSWAQVDLRACASLFRNHSIAPPPIDPKGEEREVGGAHAFAISPSSPSPVPLIPPLYLATLLLHSSLSRY
ncbi:MAG: hypothetical protein DHS80DRAFT_32494 [Piptocephalis tieghemiana]|nr:MAG: hypothetical protein DHS80DRAFT_32494 [Piptocephalis tieghemiana]